MLYKLDGGIDHMLVDEAQDTSPAQWVIRALTEEFFAGAGAREAARTLFVVGDEKQSIYSFQGAALANFAAIREAFAEPRRAAGLPWRHEPLDLSFRSVRRCSRRSTRLRRSPRSAAGVSSAARADPACRRPHRPRRAGRALAAEQPEDGRAGEPGAARRQPADSPGAARARIAATIHELAADGRAAGAEGRPIRAGDILILVRARRRSAPAIYRR